MISCKKNIEEHIKYHIMQGMRFGIELAIRYPDKIDEHYNCKDKKYIDDILEQMVEGCVS
jgi:hypothetical protein